MKRFWFILAFLILLAFPIALFYFLPSNDNSCPRCQQLEDRIIALETRIGELQNQNQATGLSDSQTDLSPPSLSPTAAPVAKSSGQSVSYVPIPGSGSLLSYTWADLPGTDFYFDPADFSGLSAAYFEANMKLLNGNGKAFLRLFDVTHGIEVWGSEVSTASQTSVAVVSSKVLFRPGNNLIRVQAKSLTADTTVFNSGRLKIISRP